MYDTTPDAAAEAFPDDWLRRLLRGLVRAGGLLESHDHSGLRLSLSEVFALAELADAGTLSQQELADRLGLEKSTVSRLVRQLEKRKWIKRASSAPDRRIIHIQLTPSGQAAAQRLADARHSKFDDLLAALPKAKRASILEAMHGRRDRPERLAQARARATEFYRWERAAEEAERVFAMVGDAERAR